MINYINDNDIYSKNKIKKEIQIQDSETYIYMLFIKYYNISLIYYFFFYNASELIKNIKKIKITIDINNITEIINNYDDLIKFKSYNNDIILNEEINNTKKILNKYDNIINILKKYLINKNNDDIISIINHIFFIKDSNIYTISYKNLETYNIMVNEMLLFEIILKNIDKKFDNINMLYKKITNKNLLIETYVHMYKLYINFFNKLENNINIILNKKLENRINEIESKFDTEIYKIHETIFGNKSYINNLINTIISTYIHDIFNTMLKNNIYKNISRNILNTAHDIDIENINKQKIIGGNIENLKLNNENNLNYIINNIVYHNFNRLTKIDTTKTIDENFFIKIFILMGYIYNMLLKRNDDIYKSKFFEIINLLEKDIHNINLHNIENLFIKYINNELIQSHDVALYKFVTKYNFNNNEINQNLNNLFDIFDKESFIYINKLYIQDTLLNIYKKLSNIDIIEYDYTNIIKIHNNPNDFVFNNKYITIPDNLYDILNNLKYNLVNKKCRLSNINTILIENYDQIINYIDINHMDLNTNYFNIEHITYDNYIKYEYYMYLIKNILNIIKHHNITIDIDEFFLLKYFKLYYKIKMLIYEYNLFKYNNLIFNKKIFYNIIKLKIIRQILIKNNVDINSFLILSNVFNKYY